MTQTPENDDFREDGFVADGEMGSDGPEAPFEVPDDASSLTDPQPSDVDSPVIQEPSADLRMPGESGAAASEEDKLRSQLSERTADLQRLQAEYVNYKRRVDRDRDVARQRGVESVVNDLLPVLDAIDAARQHGSVEGGFALVVDALEKVTTKHGLVAYGEVGEAFDPMLHEALMQMPAEGDHTEPIISAVMQKGIKLGDRIVRPARVGVANPN